MTNVTKATPRAYIEGIDDRSRRTPSVEPEQIPQHLPHIYAFTERGDTLPQVVVGNSLVASYGARSFDYLGPYANHQTVLANVVNARGNAIMMQRLKPADATTSMLRLSLEVIKEELPVYQRVPATGDILTNSAGVPQQEMNGAIPVTTIGYKVRWLLATPTGAFGAAAPTVGTLTSTVAGVSAMVYPIADFEVSSFGGYGDRIGLRLSAPTTRSAVPTDATLAAQLKSFIYRWQMVERPIDASTPNIVRSELGETSIDLVLNRDKINTRLGTKLSVEDTLIQRYQALNVPGVTPKQGPFGKMHLYFTHLEDVLTTLTAGEGTDPGDAVGEGAFDATAATYGRTSALAFSNAANKHLLNIVSGKDLNGVPYFNFVVLGAADGGVLLSENSTQYATGGSDGDITVGNFDTLVGNETANYGALAAPVLNRAKYPQSIIYDTGFSLETKKKMLTPLGLRKDIFVVLAAQELGSWQDVSSVNTWVPKGPNDIITESAMLTALKAQADLYPESEIYGTSVCRAAVVGHCGHLLNSNYKGWLPLTIDLANKLAGYMGASNGRWTSGQAFDEAPRNQVTMFTDVNLTYKPDTVYDADWEKGLIWVQDFDRSSQFYPAFQTVYSDDTSVLNSLVTALACVECEKVNDRVWRLLTGNTSLTKAQFVERGDELIEQYTKDRFDQRFIIVPETYFTDADSERGYSWKTKIKLYANNMKTVGVMTIESYRMEDFGQ